MIQMVSAELNQDKRSSQPYIISRMVFTALNPWDQLAARALEQCGMVQIVEDSEQDSRGARP
ncbi:hypothetical protein [Methanogenium organophilum]|uniref:Uncharacterized protein n=1 Tax=Methanogenium organophilum TaxID=2199 RepID=A0A9X9S4B5_METOG|nr:hypothetical protein [Methanogenium organophilum]WAI01237.1 hypothetical protein OU421_12620 [Methanogenium organophilum]